MSQGLRCHMLKTVRITNFKSLSDVTVRLDPMTVLVGRSGSGKTNFIEGLRFWRNHLTHRNFSPIGGQENWPRILSATDPRAPLGFEVVFTVNGFADDFVYRVSYDPNPTQPHVPPKLIAEFLACGDNTLFHQSQGKWVVASSLLGSSPAGNLMLGLSYGVPEDKFAYLSLTQGLGCYDFSGDVLRGEGGHARNQTPSALRGLEDHAENYLDAFESISNDLSNLTSLREIVAALKKLNPAFKALSLDTQSKKHILVAHQVAGGASVTFRLSQQSEGFRRFLAHLIALYQIPARPTLVFEEPEKGIFPAALATLADYFSAVSESGRSQVLLTTHSSQLLDHFPVEAIRVVELRDFVTRVGPVSPEQVEAVKESLLTTGELLTVDMARTQATSNEAFQPAPQ